MTRAESGGRSVVSAVYRTLLPSALSQGNNHEPIVNITYRKHTIGMFSSSAPSRDAVAYVAD
jgi:hypothetical protein